MDIIIVILLGVLLALTAALLFRQTDKKGSNADLLNSVQGSVKTLGEVLSANQKNTDELQSRKLLEMDKNIMERQEAMNQSVLSALAQMENRLKTFETGNEQKLENMRQTIETRLTSIQGENEKKLEDIRKTVDEKLQKTMEEKMNRSFQLVSERLEQVYKGLGEMQTLAAGVGDLKKVLSNVKTRGILGEIQLGAILKEILSSEQYAVNIATKPNSRDVVEFAVKMPVGNGESVYLPIDSKFPADVYMKLQEARDSASQEAVQAAVKELSVRLRQCAKDIHDKYVEPPYTTEFAILFLPFEGLYAEVVNCGLLEPLQQNYRVNVAGPSTMAALLNSLQMGFRTVAIQKRSLEVWNVLGAVKTEFDKFATILESTQQRITQANKELDKLVGVRTRAIQRKLRDVEKIDNTALLDLSEETEE